jgi:hypothetical protein
MQGIKPTQLEQESTYEPHQHLHNKHLITNNQLTQLILNQEGNQIAIVCVCVCVCVRERERVMWNS